MIEWMMVWFFSRSGFGESLEGVGGLGLQTLCYTNMGICLLWM